MKPLSLRLRGAIGIYDGLGLDEVAIDFEKYGSGLIALVGPNGSGKTTILENLHPYLQLASRDGSLSNHFRLRDSLRELKWELQGHIYESKILVDSQTAKTEAYLLKDGNPVNDGKVNTYKAAIEKLLGSPELFFRSIFSSQNSESFTALTPGKRKELFMELLGLQKYDRYSEKCRENINALEIEISNSRGKLDQIYSETAKRTVIEKELTELNIVLRMKEKAIEAIQQEIDKEAVILKANDLRIAENEGKKKQTDALWIEIAELEKKEWNISNDFKVETGKLKEKAIENEQELERKKKIVSHKKEIESNLSELFFYRGRMKVWDEKKVAFMEVAQAESKARFEHREIINANEKLNQQWKNEKEKIEEELNQANINSSLVNEVPCGSISGLPERCKLLSSAINARERIPVLTKALEENGKRTVNPIPGFDGSQFEIKKQEIGYKEEQHQLIKEKLEDLERNKWESLSEELKISESMIVEKEKGLKEIEDRIEALVGVYQKTTEGAKKVIDEKKKTYDEIRTSLLSESDRLSFKKHKDALELTIATFNAQNDRRISVLGEIKFRVEMIKRTDELKLEAEKIEGELIKKISSMENYKLVQRACSKDGIPALELDSAGPEVSRIANELLTSTFGPKYQISFETTKVSKDGKKQIETFDIKIYGDEGEKKIEDLSGGQRVWIETALQESIAIYLSEKSGKEFLTSFADEKDGALDPENKQHFIEMMREAFRIGRRFYSFVITQTPEIWGQIQQRLNLYPEDGRIEQIL